MTRNWSKIRRDGLNTEPRRGAEVLSSFRPRDLQNAEKVITGFEHDDTEYKLSNPTLQPPRSHMLELGFNFTSVL